MNMAVPAGFVLAVLLTIVLLLAVRLKAYRATGSQSSSQEIRDSFSPQRYEPMVRLLSNDDLAFLEAQPGYRKRIVRKLRRERRRIFRMYLAELAGDFQRLHAEARSALGSAPAESADLVFVVLRQRLTFWRALMLLEFRLLIPWMTPDPSGLVRVLESMQIPAIRQAA